MKNNQTLVYLDNAATTFPKPHEVTAQTLRAVRDFCGNPGRSSHRISMRAAEAVYETRSKIASLMGGEAENVIFTSSATHSLNLGIKSVLQRGDHVLISDIEHNSVIRPIAALAERGLITYDVYRAESDPDKANAALIPLIRSNTSLVIACHHSNVCNLVQPIEVLGRTCRKNGILFLVDAAQSAGAIDINMERDRIDILCAPGHKGLYGIPGSGFALFGKELPDRDKYPLYTLMEGGNGIRSRDTAMPEFLPERMEAGTLAVPAISALGAGIDFLKRQGIENVHRHECGLYEALHAGLRRFEDRIRIYGDGKSGSILLFSAREYPSEELAETLDRYGICVRAGLHCAPTAHRRLGTPDDGAVRVSFGVFNTQKDVHYLLSVLEKILNGRG